MTLNVAADHAHVFVPVHLEVKEGRQETPCFQFLQKDVLRDLDGKRINAPAIYHAWHHAIATRLTGGALACPRTFYRFKIWDLSSHNNLHNLVMRNSSKAVVPSKLPAYRSSFK